VIDNHGLESGGENAAGLRETVVWKVARDQPGRPFMLSSRTNQ